MTLLRIQDYQDPFFGLNAGELLLAIVVIFIACWFVGWLVRTFRP